MARGAGGKPPALEHPHLLKNYARAPITIVRGEGCWLIDDHGERYLDLVAGIAVCALGHAHPAIVGAIAAQAATLVHASNLYHHEPAGELANKLAAVSGFERIFFCNSGTEANEAALKLARKRAFRLGQRERNVILACRGSFHGRTFGALAATDNPKYHEGFEPLPGGFAFTPFNDVAALEHAIDATVAALIVEPIQGESGVFPATAEFLQAARRLTQERGALLIFDEIQTGMGRTGQLFAYQRFGVKPDAMTVAKALANGLPIGALLVTEEAAAALQPGDHGTTFGGSPVPCAAALAHLNLRDRMDLDGHVRAMGDLLLGELREIATQYAERFDEPRGVGLMLGLPVKEPHLAKDLVAAALAECLLINAAGRNTIRLVPPLIIGEPELREALRRLRRAIVSWMNA
ncbi:MAG: aspartate aminotransferase family protein [Candidatus Eremiobacteraeota bacterium]|nr:aspartate aminotransferase family protein [Candidatus Eremiobacteraeota bacterium]